MPGDVSEYLNKLLWWNKNGYDFWLVAKLDELLQMEVLEPEIYVEAKLCFRLFAIKPKISFQTLLICSENFAHRLSLHKV